MATVFLETPNTFDTSLPLKSFPRSSKMLLTFVFLNIEKDLLIVIWDKKFHVITIKRSIKESTLYVVVALNRENFFRRWLSSGKLVALKRDNIQYNYFRI